MKVNKIKWSAGKAVKGTRGTVRTFTMNFKYTPPTETEKKITKVQGTLSGLKPLLTYLLGMKAGSAEIYGVNLFQSTHVIKDIIDKAEESLRELKAQDAEEKKKVSKKRK